MDGMNGVIEISTGYLLRAGYCDFTTDGSFNPETEEQHGDCPQDCKIYSEPYPTVTHWTGEIWDEVPKT